MKKTTGIDPQHPATNPVPEAANQPGDQLSGPQGVDKAPGEDAADDPTEGSTVAETQKAKKVDADPTKP